MTQDRARTRSGPAWLRLLPAMTLRRRLVIAFAGLVTIAVGLVGGISYSATVSTFYSEMDRTLISAATTVAAGGSVATGNQPGGEHGPGGPRAPGADGTGGAGPGAGPGTGPGGGTGGAGPSGSPGGGTDHGPDNTTISLVQHISPGGTVTVQKGAAAPLDVDAAQRRIAVSPTPGHGRFDERASGDETYRVYTVAQGGGRGAVVVGLNVDEATRVLTRIAVNTALIGLGVILLAALAGWWMARQITRRLAALSQAAESVARTGDLGVPVQTGGRDEVARLAASMRSMLAQLGQSRDAQRRLVEDAGHELRTPITSLRTNARVLRRVEDLAADDRARLLDDVDGELGELTALVDELVELATDTRAAEPAQPTALAPLLRTTADRVGRRRGRVVTVDADESVLPVRAHAVERAVGNLLDNAAKFDPGGTAPIQVEQRGGVIRVSDRGPGVPPEELEQIFDRFYRSASSRSLPGSGLGLAIVRDVAARHGGTVTAAARPGGGLVVTLTLDGDPDQKP